MGRTSGTATRSRILTQALRAFGRHGYAETSLDDVAAAVGIRKQSLLYHFPTKDELFSETATLAAKRLAAALERALRPDPVGLARLDALVGAVLDLARRRPSVPAVIGEVARLGPPFSDRLADAMRPMADAAVEWLERSMESGLVRRQNPRVALLSIYGAVFGHIAASSVRDVLLDGIGRERADAELVSFLRASLEPVSVRTHA